MAKFLKNRDAFLTLSMEMQQRRDLFINLMKNSRFTLRPSYGSYFICGTYEKISDERDKDLAVRMTKELKVATIPVSAFYHDSKDDKVIRFCFSKKTETLEIAAERLSKL